MQKNRLKWTNSCKNKIQDYNANGAAANLMKMRIISIFQYVKIILKRHRIKIIKRVQEIKNIDKMNI